MKWILFMFFLSAGFAEEIPFPWLVYYADQQPIEAFAPYNPIILDSVGHPPLRELIKQKKTLLGYLDIAESSITDAIFSYVKKRKLLIDENRDFPGSFSVDVRDKFWQQILLHKIIPNILSQGFTGLFLDQADVAIALEQKDPEKYGGMSEAVISLIEKIRKKYPGIRIMLNRGYEILPRVGDKIDYLLAETLFTSYDFATQKYLLRSEGEIQWQLSQINSARKQFPHLTVFSLDYWDPMDKESYKKIYSLAKSEGLRAYVSIPALNVIVPY